MATVKRTTKGVKQVLHFPYVEPQLDIAAENSRATVALFGATRLRDNQMKQRKTALQNQTR